MIQLWLCALHKYPRFPKLACSNPASSTLVILTDASLSIVINCYQVMSTHAQAKQNENKANPVWTPSVPNFLTHKSFLASDIVHIPQRELQGLSLGSQLLKQIVSELGLSLCRIILGIDARVAIWWAIASNNDKMSIFVKNRSTIIKNEINQATQLLYDIHMSENLDNIVTRNPPTSDSYLDIITWVPAELMSADLGSKYETFSNKTGQNKLISHEAVGPGCPGCQTLNNNLKIKLSLLLGI